MREADVCSWGVGGQDPSERTGSQLCISVRASVSSIATLPWEAFPSGGGCLSPSIPHFPPPSPEVNNSREQELFFLPVLPEHSSSVQGTEASVGAASRAEWAAGQAVDYSLIDSTSSFPEL